MTADTILDAALEVVGERGWRSVGPAEIAERAGTDLAAVHRHFPTRGALAQALVARVNAAALSGSEFESGDTVMDRLFDLIMRRFDALQPHRGALRSIWRDLPRDPFTGLALAPRLANAMAWMLEAAGAPPRGLSGLVRVKVLAAIYLSAMRTWLGDESEDRAATMARLDRELKRWGRCLG